MSNVLESEQIKKNNDKQFWLAVGPQIFYLTMGPLARAGKQVYALVQIN